MGYFVLLLSMCLVTNSVFASSYAQSDEFRFVNLDDSFLLGEEFSIVFKKMTRQPCPSYDVILMKEGISGSKITYSRQPLCAVSGLVEPYLFSDTFEKLVFFDSIGTYSIKVVLDDKIIDKKIKITNSEYYSSIHPPLKQINSGIALFDVKCSEEKHLVYKYDRMRAACVNGETETELINRGWALLRLGFPDYARADLSSSLCGNYGGKWHPEYDGCRGDITDLQCSLMGGGFVYDLKICYDGICPVDKTYTLCVTNLDLVSGETENEN
ncbi:MAG: hypothetical protein ACW9W3_06445 [Candidatus Nitrosopumilus sp. bin_68KS]